MTQPHRVVTPFSKESTAADVVDGIDLTGQSIVVTGGASGIGIESTRALARAGASVAVAVRDVEQGTAVAGQLMSAGNIPVVHVAYLDLTKPSSIQAFVDEWTGPLHVLINNAGVMVPPDRTLTDHGWELQLATNHLGNFALALGLWPALAAAEGARVVSVSSSAHLRSPVLFDDLHFSRHEYEPWIAYGQSKTANVLFAVQAHQRWVREGITVNAVTPGVVHTGLMRHTGDDFAESLARRFGGACHGSPQSRARPHRCWQRRGRGWPPPAGATWRTATKHGPTWRGNEQVSRRTPWTKKPPNVCGASPPGCSTAEDAASRMKVVLT